MRKIIRFLLMVIAVLALLSVGGVVAFIAQFDANQFKPQLVEQLQKTLGRPVELGPISLGFKGGLALTFKDLAVYPDLREEAQPLFQVEEVRGIVKLLPLLKKEIQLSSLSLVRPQVQVIQSPQGQLELLGLTPPPAPDSELLSEGVPPPVLQEPAPRIGIPGGRMGEFPLEVGALEIVDGTFVYTDLKQTPEMRLVVRHLDLSLKNVSATRPIRFKGQMAVLGDEPNLQVHGRLQLPSGKKAGSLSRFRLEADLSKVDLQELAQAFPVYQEWGLREKQAGKLVVTLDELSLDAHGWEEVVASTRFSNGRIQLPGARMPLEEVSFEAVAERGRIDLKNFFARGGEGTIQLSGTIEELTDVGQASLQVQVQALPLQSLLPVVHPAEPQLHGNLGTQLQVQFQGTDALQILQTISGDGRVTLEKGMVANLNVLREVFQRMTILPGLNERLLGRLGPSYRERFEAEHTSLRSMDFEIQLDEGILRFQDLTVATEDFELSGSGRIRLSDQRLEFPAVLRIEPELTGAILRSVEDLQILTDSEGWLEIPVEVRGILPQISIRPDLEYLASRLLVTKAQELLGDLLQKVLGDDE